jgi:hypothetical protein
MNINYISRFEINDELLDVRNPKSFIYLVMLKTNNMLKYPPSYADWHLVIACTACWADMANLTPDTCTVVAWIYFSTVCSISFPSLWASRALDLFHSRIVVSSPCTKPHLVRLLIIITNNIKSGKNLKGTDLSWSRISTRMESWSREMVKSSVWWKSKLRLKCNINCEIYCHILLSFYLA